MKKILKIALLMFCIFVAEQSLALRCGNKLIDIGDPKPKVIHICGEPDYQEIREVRYPSNCNDGRYQYDDYPYDRRGYKRHYFRRDTYNYIRCQYRTIDVWLYNFGPRKFMKELVFRRGVVKEINTLEYGY